ncbi:MAG: hypothetical protein ACYCU0_08935, partial [Solirubrobacteraceae bacterium]
MGLLGRAPGGHRQGKGIARPKNSFRTEASAVGLRTLLAAGALACAAIAVWPISEAAAIGSPCRNEAARAGASAALPDCRAYEQVSPGEKGGSETELPSRALPAEAAPGGEAIAYLGTSSFPGGAGSTPLFNAHLSTREASGWATSELTPPKTSPGPPGNYTVEYAFSEDLRQSVVDVPLQQLAPGATPGMYNLFERGAAGEYSLVDALPPLVAPPGSCREAFEPNCYLFVDVNVYAGASASFDRIL